MIMQTQEWGSNSYEYKSRMWFQQLWIQKSPSSESLNNKGDAMQMCVIMYVCLVPKGSENGVPSRKTDSIFEICVAKKRSSINELKTSSYFPGNNLTFYIDNSICSM